MLSVAGSDDALSAALTISIYLTGVTATASLGIAVLDVSLGVSNEGKPNASA